MALFSSLAVACTLSCGERPLPAEKGFYVCAGMRYQATVAVAILVDDPAAPTLMEFQKIDRFTKRDFESFLTEESPGFSLVGAEDWPFDEPIQLALEDGEGAFDVLYVSTPSESGANRGLEPIELDASYKVRLNDGRFGTEPGSVVFSGWRQVAQAVNEFSDRDGEGASWSVSLARHDVSCSLELSQETSPGRFLMVEFSEVN